MINNYIYSNRNAEALEYLNTAISKDPNNAQLYDVMGRVYETGMKDYAKAEEYFKKALDMDGDNADILSNLGRVYYNQAVQQQTAANEITDQTQYQAELAKAKELFTKAMPYFEKAHQINPEARDVMTALRGIYYNLNMGDKFFTPFFEKLMGVDYVRKMIEEGKSADEIKAMWQDDVERFKAQRKPYLLYSE